MSNQDLSKEEITTTADEMSDYAKQSDTPPALASLLLEGSEKLKWLLGELREEQSVTNALRCALARKMECVTVNTLITQTRDAWRISGDDGFEPPSLSKN